MEVTNLNFDEVVLASPVPVLADFFAEWCPPCRALIPTIKELDAEANGKYKVVKIDVGANNDLAARFDVGSIPTLIAFKEGNETGRLVGVHSKDKLLKLLRS